MVNLAIIVSELHCFKQQRPLLSSIFIRSVRVNVSWPDHITQRNASFTSTRVMVILRLLDLVFVVGSGEGVRIVQFRGVGLSYR
jgi:hypothetical protein